MIDLAQEYKAKCDQFDRDCLDLMSKLCEVMPETNPSNPTNKEKVLLQTICTATILRAIIKATIKANGTSMPNTEHLATKLGTFARTLQGVAYDMFKDDIMKG